MIVLFYGLIIGIFVTLTGGGGATLYLGVLTGQLGIPVSTAVPTSLFITIPALFFGFVTQLKIKNVDLKTGNRMILSAVPGILVGTFISKYINSLYYNWVVGGLLIIMGLLVLIKFFRTGRKVEERHEKKYSKIVSTFLGLISGLMVGIGGLSGGATTVSGLTLLGVPAIIASGTTTYVLWIMSVLGFICHLFTSKIDWFSGLYLMIGAIIGSIIGPLLVSKLNPEKFNKILTPVLGFLIVYFGINMIMQ